ncbi:ThiF family adenylyltransferase, partial [Sphingobacteriales bacterium CHB3]|nr:ThiF family adenylyltransferase [Sphingobacteriales bacterium CHB3]
MENNMSTKLSQADLEFPEDVLKQLGQVNTIYALGIPAPHSAEAETFARHVGVPGHVQTALVNARIIFAGAGGLNGLAVLGFLRSGARNVTVIDPDLVERTNLPRQLFFGKDLGQPKATRLIENLREDAIAGASLTGMAMRFEEAVEKFVLPADLLVVGVDRNDCRKYGVELARKRGISAIFTMLSTDGMRCQCFLQGPDPSDACLWCALPNLDPEHILPCASAVITSCLLASALTLFFGHRALMGWPQNVEPYNFREVDLLG